MLSSFEETGRDPAVVDPTIRCSACGCVAEESRLTPAAAGIRGLGHHANTPT